MKNCIIKINEALETMSKKELIIARYILNNQKKVSKMTVLELAQAAKCSTATIIRFCYTLGYDGFREFTKSFYHDVESRGVQNFDSVPLEFENIPNTERSIKSIINSISKANIEAIENSTKLLDPEKVKNAVNLINKARKVYFYGIGGSSIVAIDAVFKFQRIGIDSQAFDSAHSQIISASILKPTDVAIIISYSGETKDILSTMEVIKKVNAKCIAITKYGDNSVSRQADISLQHSSMGASLRQNSTRSRIAQLNIIDILFISLASKRSEQLKNFYELTSKIFGEAKTQSNK